MVLLGRNDFFFGISNKSIIFAVRCFHLFLPCSLSFALKESGEINLVTFHFICLLFLLIFHFSIILSSWYFSFNLFQPFKFWILCFWLSHLSFSFFLKFLILFLFSSIFSICFQCVDRSVFLLFSFLTYSFYLFSFYHNLSLLCLQ